MINTPDMLHSSVDPPPRITEDNESDEDDDADNSDARIVHNAIQSNNLKLVLSFSFSNEDLVNIRVNNQLNILQAACFFNAESIIVWLRDKFRKDPENA